VPEKGKMTLLENSEELEAVSASIEAAAFTHKERPSSMLKEGGLWSPLRVCKH